jgi:hypothetical protein
MHCLEQELGIYLVRPQVAGNFLTSDGYKCAFVTGADA